MSTKLQGSNVSRQDIAVQIAAIVSTSIMFIAMLFMWNTSPTVPKWNFNTLNYRYENNRLYIDGELVIDPSQPYPICKASTNIGSVTEEKTFALDLISYLKKKPPTGFKFEKIVINQMALYFIAESDSLVKQIWSQGAELYLNIPDASPNPVKFDGPSTIRVTAPPGSEMTSSELRINAKVWISGISAWFVVKMYGILRFTAVFVNETAASSADNNTQPPPPPPPPQPQTQYIEVIDAGDSELKKLAYLYDGTKQTITLIPLDFDSSSMREFKIVMSPDEDSYFFHQEVLNNRTVYVKLMTTMDSYRAYSTLIINVTMPKDTDPYDDGYMYAVVRVYGSDITSVSYEAPNRYVSVNISNDNGYYIIEIKNWDSHKTPTVTIKVTTLIDEPVYVEVVKVKYKFDFGVSWIGVTLVATLVIGAMFLAYTALKFLRRH